MKYLKYLTFIIILLLITIKSETIFGQTSNKSNQHNLDLENKIEQINAYYEGQKFDSALIMMEKVVEESKAANDDIYLARALLLRGRINLSNFGPRDKPTRDFLEALSLFKKLNDSLEIANCNLQLGVLNFDIQNYKAAIGYFNSVIQLKQKNNRQTAITHYLLAISHSELGNFKKANEFFTITTKETDPTDTDFVLQIETFKGKMFLNQGEINRAIDHFTQLINSYKFYIEKEIFAPIYTFLSSAYLANKNYQKVIEYGNKSFYQLEGKGSYSIYLRESMDNLQKAYHAIGKQDSAYYFLNALSNFKDNETNSQILQRISELSGQYEFEQKMQTKKIEQEYKDEIAAQELENEVFRRNLLLAAFVLSLIIAVLFLNQRNKLSKEKGKSDALLLNILPANIAEELKQTGRSEARNFELVSILFTDFKEFTQASELLTAKELVAEINACFEAFDTICQKYQIEKIKTIGDAYMAAGGLIIHSEDAVKNTILAGLEMQRFILDRMATNNANRKNAFEMRLGIHTGPVVAGIAGTNKFQYDIWGDAVNTASRMESHGHIGKVNISKITYDFVKNDPDFIFEHRGKIQAKGKGEIDMYYVELKLA